MLLVDDHALVLEGLRNFLEISGIEVIGTAKNGVEALLQYEMLQPDLVLMDIQMADCDGIQATQMIRKEYPEAKIVMLTASEDDESVFAAIRAGAQGYLRKDMDPASFIRQLMGINNGEMPLAPGLAARLLREFSCNHKTVDETANGEVRELTARQTDVLQLLSEGMTYKEIAVRLYLAEVTVKYHVKEILAKLQLDNRAQLIAHALRQRINKE